jgi:sulfur carrier protein
MNVVINQNATELPDGATVAHAVAAIAARPPFAVAVNTVFVPQARHAQHALQPGDRVEIIAPVTGG